MGLALPRRDGHATPGLGRDIGHGLGEGPEMTCRVTHAVLPLAVCVVGGLAGHLRAGGDRGTVMRIDVVDANHD